VRFEDVGEWLEYIRFRWVGERGGWRFDVGTARVAALAGGVRIWSFGRLMLSRSADLVSMRRRLGTLGRFGGGGRRKARWEGGGDGVVSNSTVVVGDEDRAVGITGNGE
jgi:hypothetical protein